MVSLNVLWISVALIKLELNNFIWFCHLFHLKNGLKRSMCVSNGGEKEWEKLAFCLLGNSEWAAIVFFCLIMPSYAIDKFKSKVQNWREKFAYAHNRLNVLNPKTKTIRVNRNFSKLIGKRTTDDSTWLLIYLFMYFYIAHISPSFTRFSSVQLSSADFSFARSLSLPLYAFTLFIFIISYFCFARFSSNVLLRRIFSFIFVSIQLCLLDYVMRERASEFKQFVSCHSSIYCLFMYV